MATERYLEMADTARKDAALKAGGDRRTSGGSQFQDASLLPVGLVTLDVLDVARVMRIIYWRARNTDDRIQLLAQILGE